MSAIRKETASLRVEVARMHECLSETRAWIVSIPNKTLSADLQLARIDRVLVGLQQMSTPSTHAPAYVDETAKDRQIAELEAEVERLRDLSGIYDLAQMNGKLMSQVYAAESALKASREIADGLAGALRVFGDKAPPKDEKWPPNSLWAGRLTFQDFDTARQALFAYDAARKGDGENER